ILEKADSEDGPWSEVTTVKAAVSGDKATAKYKFPKPPKKGHLTKVEWKRTKAKPGDQLGMHVEATDYEGGFLSIHVEKRGENGEWDVYSRWSGEIEQGKFDTIFLIPKGKEKPEQWKAGKVVELSFDGEPKESDTLWMVAKTQGFDGSSLQFVLERTDENGNWAELGTAVSTVKDGQAKNSLSVTPFVKIARRGEAGPEGHVAIKFGKNVFHKNEELVVWVDPRWLQGKGFEVTMERRVMEDGSAWEEVAVVDAEPAEAKGPGASDPHDAPPVDQDDELDQAHKDEADRHAADLDAHHDAVADAHGEALDAKHEGEQTKAEAQTAAKHGEELDDHKKTLEDKHETEKEQLAKDLGDKHHDELHSALGDLDQKHVAELAKHGEEHA